jgi:hypothetical protein
MMNDGLVEDAHDEFNGYGQANIEIFNHQSMDNGEEHKERKKKSILQQQSTHSVSRS